MRPAEAGAGGAAGMTPVDAGADAEAGNDAATADSGTDADSPDEPTADGGEDRDAGKHAERSQRKSASGCSARGPTDNGAATSALVFALWVASSKRRRRTQLA